MTYAFTYDVPITAEICARIMDGIGPEPPAWPDRAPRLPHGVGTALRRGVAGQGRLAAGCTTAGGNADLTSASSQPEEPDITVAAIPAVDLACL